MTRAAKTAKKQGRPFKKGKSGNPAGRPQGSRNKATLAMERLLNGEADRLTLKAVDLAMKGDTTALRLCLESLDERAREALELKYGDGLSRARIAAQFGATEIAERIHEIAAG